MGKPFPWLISDRNVLKTWNLAWR